LWHQPIFAFARINMYEHPSTSLMLALSVINLLLAYLTWKYIETPFRYEGIWTTKRIFSLSLIGIMFFGTIGIIGHVNNGFMFRFSDKDLEFLSQIDDKKDKSNYVVEQFNLLQRVNWQDNKKNVFLIGDSYAQDLINAVYEANLDKNLSISTWRISKRCGNLYLPFTAKEEFISPIDMNMCLRDDVFNDQDFENRLKSANEIWLASSWTPWQVELIALSLVNIQSSSNAVIRIFGRKDFPYFKPQKYLGLSPEEREIFVEPISLEKINLNKRFKELTKDYSFIDVQTLICGGNVGACKMFDNNGNIKTYDGSHLTKFGAKFYGEKLEKIIGMP